MDAHGLTRIDSAAREAALGSMAGAESSLNSAFYLRSQDGHTIHLSTRESLLQELNSQHLPPKSLIFHYEAPQHSAVDVEFQDGGKILLTAFSPDFDFPFRIERLTRELLACDPGYNWFVRRFILDRLAARGLAVAAVVISFFLSSIIAYYFYAQSVGTDVDPTVIPRGNESFRKVADALKSGDVSQKLDALLVSQLRNFHNLQDVLLGLERAIMISLIIILLAGLLLYARRLVLRLYPNALFVFGAEEKRLNSILRKREILLTAVLIGFIVNLVAGFLITVLS